jgi:adenylate cyclase
MSIRNKIVIIVLPLIIAPLLVTGYVSSLSARNGITHAVTGLLRFKQEELVSYAGSQWQLLVDNGLASNDRFVAATKSAVTSFAQNMIRSGTELIAAVDGDAKVIMATRPIELAQDERTALIDILRKQDTGFHVLSLGGVTRVAQIAPFVPFHWYFLVTDERDAFYSVVTDMYVQTGWILALSLATAIILLFVFAYLLIRPLKALRAAMRGIIATNDLSRKVDIAYADEIGDLGHTFNLMTRQLEQSSDLVKSYALKAVVAQHKEQKVRNIFQKYVPKNVIDQFFANPEKMLVGDDRVLAVLFSDIRGFTALSEKMRPDEVVESLNAYFSRMVDVIVNRNGVVDKYIGDAIMAFYGAPLRRGDEAQQSIYSAFEMLSALGDFNAWQRNRGRPEFRIGIGINYGLVTVGNIGSEKKMDYTVIGDMVNLASRLEGLCKVYHQELVFSESVARKIQSEYPCRLLERVIVQGKTTAIGLYTAKEKRSPAEEAAWATHEKALARYFSRDFAGALALFQEVHGILPDDVPAALFMEKCHAFMRQPPPENWNGAAVMAVK